ncbi:MAG: MBL fold metallo-hydrolase [Flavobacteriales bacterium]
MKIKPIHSGFFKLDGGAMFGVVPKTIWSKTNPPDENNLCTWAMRCLLVETGDHKILVDTGLGDKQSEKFFSFVEPHGDYSLEASLKKEGLGFEDITDVFLTHLHFDHCGGAIKWKDEKQEELVPTFPNATYWCNERHWEWATNPNAREKASFLKENILPMKESGQLRFVDRENGFKEELFPGFSVLFVDGHTESQMLPVLNYNDKTIVYTADLIPSAGHIPLPYVMGFDVRPLHTLEEKEKFLDEAEKNNYILFFEHDPVNECAKVKRTEKGVRLDETFAWKEVEEVESL